MKILLAAAASAIAMASAAFADGPVPQADNTWYKQGQAAIQARLAVQPNTNRAKNVIILIADGNGVATNGAIRIWQGQQMGKLGEEHVLAYETFPNIALSKTYNTNAQTPDSAGTGTAMMTGIKTKAGVLGVDETVSRGDCNAAAKGAVASIGDLFAQDGRSVGFVSTARITHATPASGYAKVADRNYEDNSSLPDGCTVPDIAAQLIADMKSGVVDIALGGGRRHFLPKDVKGDEGKAGKRTDGKNLIEEAKAAGIQYVWDDKTAAAADLGKPILGLFESSHMKYENDRSGEPTLAQMTAMAIKALSKNGKGFFLQIEGGRVDHANHDGNLHRVVTDDKDTLIIVTADHEHAIAFNGYCGRGTPITGLCYKIDNKGTKYKAEPNLAADGKPYTVVGYLNGAGSVLKKQADGSFSGTRPDLTQEQATDADYLQQALIPMSSETHSGEDVAIYAKGPFSHLVNGTMEQSEIFHVMMHAATGK